MRDREDRATVLRRRIDLYREYLRQGVDADRAREYLRQILAAEAELECMSEQSKPRQRPEEPDIE